MAIVKKRGTYHLAIRLNGRQVWVSAGTGSKTRAKHIERQIVMACKARDYRSLDAEARAVCVQLYQNQRWTVPEDLLAAGPLTLGRAMTDYTTTNPINIFCRFLMHFGAATPVTDIWIPQVKEYVQARQAEGAAASTINEEKAALSRLLQDLVDARMLEANPALMVPNLSEKA
ncbi:MAG: hypothetical protein V1792_21835 [Pseudomonadota bacterium]